MLVKVSDRLRGRKRAFSNSILHLLSREKSSQLQVKVDAGKSIVIVLLLIRTMAIFQRMMNNEVLH